MNDKTSGLDVKLQLINLRQTMGLSQRQMAELFNVAPGSISLWESGKRSIPGPVEKLIEIYQKNIHLSQQERVEQIAEGRWERLWAGTKFVGRAGINWMRSSLLTKLSAHEKSIELKRNTEEAIYLEFFKLTTELRGINMKLAQMFGYMKVDLPEKVKEHFKNYQFSVPPLKPETVEQIVESNLKQKTNELFDEFHKVPFASGSIGQVHYAKTKIGQEVALKIQYPGVAKAIKSDIKNLKVLSNFLSVSMNSQSKKEFLNEIKQRLEEECDYRQEAQNISEFQAAWKNDPVIVIPNTYNEYNSKQTLAMDFVRGQDFYSFLNAATQEQKNKVGAELFRFYFFSIYKHRIFNADPHPGNYLIDGEKIIFLDFGCTRRYSEDTIKKLKAVFLSSLFGTMEEFKEANINAGLVSNSKKFDFEHHYQIMRKLSDPLFKDNFRFNHYYIKDLVRGLITDSPNIRYANVVDDFVFLQRLQFGLYSILAELEAVADWRSIYLEALGVSEKLPMGQINN